MIKKKTGVALTAVVLALGGCGGDAPQPAPTAADPAAFCARWKAAQLPFLLYTAPEAKAWAKAVADSYQGKEPADAVAIQRAYFSAWAQATRPLAAQASTPELRTALTEQVAELDRRAAAGAADYTPPITRALEVCR